MPVQYSGHPRRAQGRARGGRALRRLAHGRGLVPRAARRRGGAAPRHQRRRQARRRRRHVLVRLPPARAASSTISSSIAPTRRTTSSSSTPRTSTRTSAGSSEQAGLDVRDHQPVRRDRRCSPCRGRRRWRWCSRSPIAPVERARSRSPTARRSSAASRRRWRAPATPARTASSCSSPASAGGALWDALLDAGTAHRPQAHRARRARHAAPRGAALALRQRHRRGAHAARGGPRLGRQGQGLRRRGGARQAEGRGPARASSSASS